MDFHKQKLRGSCVEQGSPLGRGEAVGIQGAFTKSFGSLFHNVHEAQSVQNCCWVEVELFAWLLMVWCQNERAWCVLLGPALTSSLLCVFGAQTWLTPCWAVLPLLWRTGSYLETAGSLGSSLDASLSWHMPGSLGWGKEEALRLAALPDTKLCCCPSCPAQLELSSQATSEHVGHAHG